MANTIINGKYAIKTQLAESHLYDIFTAVETETDTDVVVKLMKEEASADINRVKLFNEEVRAFAKLSHPGIAQIMDMDTSDNRPFVVTEPVAGVNLLTWARHEPLPTFGTIIRIVRDIATVLQYAFDEGVTRRSVKLSNIMRCDDGSIKLLSFSLPRLSLVGLGSSFDLAAGIQSDLFFLGTTLFELLTGESAIRKRGGLNETWDDILRSALRTRHAQLPPGAIEKIIENVERTLTRDMKRRFIDHTGFLVAMADLLHIAEGADRAPRAATRRDMATASEVVDAINGRRQLGNAANTNSNTNGSNGTHAATGLSHASAPIIPIGKAASAVKVASGVTHGASNPSRVSAKNGTAGGAVNSATGLTRGFATPAFDGNAALAPSIDNDYEEDNSEDDDERQSSRFGRPFLKLIKGGKNAAESIIWRAADEITWYKNPLVVMGGGLLFMILLILFW
ncbi:MAG: protein kinase [Candidatus Riflebacteria bacterium]|nr:protein kinase [Candidatus Riflebacteria bacterium]